MFFRNQKQGVKSAPPSFKKTSKYKSFTLKQSGYKLFEDNRIRIRNKVYKYHKSREIEGEIKRVTVKRDALGDIYICVMCEIPEPEVIPRAGEIVGYDFGLKRFLTASDGRDIESPEFLNKDRIKLRSYTKSYQKETRF